jgi:DNA-directed RNA polymerase subunit L
VINRTPSPTGELGQSNLRRRFKTRGSVARPVIMAVTVLKKEKNELRLRIIGESHTALQVLRESLNAHKDVDYANYVPGHPELDDPEFYIRTTSKAGVDKVLNEIISGVAAEFESANL